MRLYGLNVASLWPWSLGTYGPEKSIEMAKAAGFNGIHALPMKFWNYDRFKKWEKHVISYQDAYMYGPFWQTILRHLHIMGEPAPTIFDWLLFGKNYSTIMQALYVTPIVIDGACVEINPELSSNHRNFVRLAISGVKFCLDTYHIRRNNRTLGKFFIDWENLLEYLPRENVALIHVHPQKNEIAQLLKGDTTSQIIRIMSTMQNRFPNVPVIVEVFPPLLSYDATVKYFRDLLVATKRWLN